MAIQPTVAIDVMTAEQGINAMLQAVVSVLKQRPNVKLLLVGNRLLIEEALDSTYRLTWRGFNIEIHHTDIVIAQTDDPVWALKNKKGSSTHLAVDLVASGAANSVLSCANTGALVAISRYKLKRLPNVNKLAMIGSFPTNYRNKDVYICDVGASFDSSAHDLVCQAAMASAMLSSENNQMTPKIGILNTGAEDIKGNTLVRETSAMLRGDPRFDFYGAIEGHDIFSGCVDIVICDGFVGNCLLKACEGTANYIMSTIKKACMAGTISQIIGYLLKGVLKKQAPVLNPSLRNGALLLGLKGIVIKSHGNADRLGIETAIHTAVKASSSAYSEHLQKLSSSTKITDEVLV